MTELENEIIVEENNDEENKNEEENEPDYKALYEQAKAQAEKRKARFKSAKAQEKKEEKPQFDESIIEKKIEERLFFQNNPLAREYEKDVRDIMAKYNMPASEAYEFYLAKNKPELLLQTKSQSQVGVDGVTQEVKPDKKLEEMTDEEFMKYWESRKG